MNSNKKSTTKLQKKANNGGRSEKNTSSPEVDATLDASYQPSSSPRSSVNIKSEDTSIIAYVHNLSPSKRNRGNTMSYCSLTLQTSDQANQEALLYSMAKRSLLLQNQSSRTPVKIRNYTLTEDKSKIVINDMTNISAPDLHEYKFQYAALAQQQLTPSTVLDILNDHKEWDDVAVRGKLISIKQARTVGSPKKRLRLAEATLADATGSIPLDIWESNIDELREGYVYEFQPVQV